MTRDLEANCRLVWGGTWLRNTSCGECSRSQKNACERLGGRRDGTENMGQKLDRGVRRAEKNWLCCGDSDSPRDQGPKDRREVGAVGE